MEKQDLQLLVVYREDTREYTKGIITALELGFLTDFKECKNFYFNYADEEEIFLCELLEYHIRKNKYKNSYITFKIIGEK